jgi:hypothetical protein
MKGKNDARRARRLVTLHEASVSIYKPDLIVSPIETQVFMLSSASAIDANAHARMRMFTQIGNLRKKTRITENGAVLG